MKLPRSSHSWVSMTITSDTNVPRLRLCAPFAWQTAVMLDDARTGDIIFDTSMTLMALTAAWLLWFSASTPSHPPFEHCPDGCQRMPEILPWYWSSTTSYRCQECGRRYRLAGMLVRVWELETHNRPRPARAAPPMLVPAGAVDVRRQAVPSDDFSMSAR